MSAHWVTVGRRSPSGVDVPGPLGPAYDADRQLGDKGFWSACYAPSLSLYFDQRGRVRPCGYNQVPLGRIPDNTIREIWDGEVARRLRSSLAAGSFSRGCNHCAWQVDSGSISSVYAHKFDDYAAPTPAPAWPVQMEFSLTNACNLQCTMCNGEFSSAIRVHREHRRPMAMPYGDAFFEELVDFAPHLRKANVLGGEPFMGAESLRLLELFAAIAPEVVVNVTTNGTRWSPRIERIFEQIPLTLVLSLDAVTKQTYEQIRAGAHFETVMANLDRFQMYAEKNQTFLGLAFCLMTTNWWEFADLLRFAEDRHLPVTVNTVRFPLQFSLYHIPRVRLAQILEELDRQDRTIAAGLGSLREVWDTQLAIFHRHLEQLEAGAGANGAGDRHRGREQAEARAELRRWEATAVRVVSFGPGNELLGVESDDGTLFAVPVAEVAGLRYEAFFEWLQEPLGTMVERGTELTVEGFTTDARYTGGGGLGTEVKGIVRTVFDEAGEYLGMELHLGTRAARRPAAKSPDRSLQSAAR